MKAREIIHEHGQLVREIERLKFDAEENALQSVDDAIHRYYSVRAALERIHDRVGSHGLLRRLFPGLVRDIKSIAREALRQPKPRLRRSLGQEWTAPDGAEPPPLLRRP